jgi:hypothetical protein
VLLMFASPFTGDLARQRRDDLLAAAGHCCRQAAPLLTHPFRRLLALARRDLDRMHLGPVANGCATC